MMQTLCQIFLRSPGARWWQGRGDDDRREMWRNGREHVPALRCLNAVDKSTATQFSEAVQTWPGRIKNKADCKLGT